LQVKPVFAVGIPAVFRMNGHGETTVRRRNTAVDHWNTDNHHVHLDVAVLQPEIKAKE